MQITEIHSFELLLQLAHKGLIKGVFESDILARLFKMHKGFTA